MNKRTFLKKAAFAGLGGVLSFESFAGVVKNVASLPITDLAGDEDFWTKVRQYYKLKPDYINLENGYYNFVPEPVLEKFIEHVREVNYHGSYFMRNYRVKTRRAMAAKLAEVAGCSADELTITRNTTESLDLVIGGLNWKRGDEAVFAEQDYGSMRGMFSQISKRYGVVNRVVSVPNIPKSDEEIVNLYASVITKRTKLLMVSHMINITGQILPVRKICDMAHSKGVQVLVDGAHSLAQFRFSIEELDCDYFGSSLHKWMSVPLGCGLLYVKKEHIGKVWPLMAEGGKPSEDITRLSHIGTNPVHTDLAISAAIEFYNMLGAERKESRLRYLQNYWTSKVRELPHVILNTPADPARACAIATVGIKGIKPADLATTFFDKYKIFTVGIDGSGVNGCRITPNVYTSTDELDVLVNALKELK
ncbi:MAG TPA: aminotransferase class V-fold PLP-dependent enzyme [Chitinophagaceae bacterium]|nr:aminotransferase class V-fold PLP-dependent enzyme [Chitinophagaceae bacterium]